MGKSLLAYSPISSTTVFDYLVTSLFFLGIVFLYYYNFAVKKPKIYSRNEKLKRFLQVHVPILDRKFWPSFCYFEGRLQTIFGLTRRFPKNERLNYQQEIVTMKDGQQVGLDFLHPPVEKGAGEEIGEDDNRTHNETTLIVLIVPAFASSSQTSYIKSLALSIVNFGGATAAVLNHRGMGGVPLTIPKLSSASNCEDLREVIAHLRQKFPNAKLMVVGPSVGGMITAQYLTKYAEEAKEALCSAVLISIVWDAWSSCRGMESLINLRLVNMPMVHSCLTYLKRYKGLLESQDSFDYEKFKASKTVRDLDEIYVLPMLGYKSLEDYYKDLTLTNSAIDKLSLPVFALNALDDPAQPGQDLPIDYVKKSKSNLALIVTCRGGHLGFLEGWLPKMKPMHYMEKLVGQLVKGVRLHGKELDLYTPN